MKRRAEQMHHSDIWKNEDSMADFDVFLPLLLGFEGGYVDNPTDPGGETNKGVTMATFRTSSHSLLGVDPTSANLKALTDAQAGILYKNLYWDKMQGDNFGLQELANIVCDFYVNAGTHATSMLQTVLNNMGAHLVVDGGIGAASLQAMSALPPDQIYNNYKQQRIAYYQNLGVRYPQFLKGWLARVNAFPNL
jgi:lysozyme family protein